MGQGDPFDANPYEAPRAELGPAAGYRLPGAPGPAKVRMAVIGEAWGLLKAQLGTWVLITIVSFLCTFAVPVVFGVLQVIVQQSGAGQEAMVTLMVLYVIAVSLVSVFFMGGMFFAACKQVRGGRVEVGDLFGAAGRFGPMLLAAFLGYLAFLVGYVLLIIPGLLVLGRMMFSIPLVVDGGLGATEALGRSWSATKGQTLAAGGFIILIGLIMIAGAIPCGIGLLFTLPLYYLSIAILYRDFFSVRKSARRLAPAADDEW